ncbi:hypothetical protein BSR29_07685 [Boudabousia liubingyangii]|uniref:UvrD-like helicase C-terminal domain-containing protein n=1 Tax=Boudabousia liubingyangii TaxID=1921764 RepID=A0A1Q5PJR2_9ACTO|nr:3'-5' exonuclease [Boudabousia liubingyangii]OKL46128.1 hypothetical protein BSR29_07685 [Boudabousia liubingyangii]
MEGKLLIMTLHAAKGMEYKKVIIAGVDKESLPAMEFVRNQPEAEIEDFLLRERSLLYVAATRARDHLLVTGIGEPSNMLAVPGE